MDEDDDDLRPSIFELLSQDDLVSSLRPAFKYALRVCSYIITQYLHDVQERGSCQLIGRMPDSQLNEPGFESPFATVSKIGHFRSLHDAPVHSAV